VKTKRILATIPLLALLSTFNLQLSTVHAQGTAFNYQGRLNSGANPAGGIYDLRFTVYDAASSGSVWGVLTNVATPVTNGLFTVTLDYGSGVFTGNARWLEIAVRTNGAAVRDARAVCHPGRQRDDGLDGDQRAGLRHRCRHRQHQHQRQRRHRHDRGLRRSGRLVQHRYDGVDRGYSYESDWERFRRPAFDQHRAAERDE
jgi:hypothetical protein